MITEREGNSDEPEVYLSPSANALKDTIPGRGSVPILLKTVSPSWAIPQLADPSRVPSVDSHFIILLGRPLRMGVGQRSSRFDCGRVL